MYPAAGHSPVHMLYKYGGSILGTMNNTNRHVRMYQSENLEFVVNQSIWFEGEAKYLGRLSAFDVHPTRCSAVVCIVNDV